MKLLVGSLALLCFTGFCCVSATPISAAPKPERFDNFKVYRVHVKDEAQLKDFKNLGNELPIEYLNDVTGSARNYDIVIDPANQSRLEQLLKYLDVSYEVTIENLQTAIEGNYNRIQNDYQPMEWTQYHSLQEIYDWVNQQADNQKEHAKLYTIGYSYEGRPIKALKFSKREGNKAIMLEANIHAIEWISSATITYFMNEFFNSNDTELQTLADTYDWIFVPMMNPDGFTYSHDVSRLWRKNRRPNGFSNSSGLCYGIDMNRNFDYYWGQSGWNIDVPCDHWYGGAQPDSEPEVQALQNFINSFPDNYIRVYIAMHSYGQFLLLPYGHTNEEVPPNYDQMMRISKSFADAVLQVHGTEFTYGASGQMNYPVSGASKDWCYGVKNIPYTATLELRDQGKYGFLLPKNQIIPVGEEVTAGLKALIAEAQKEGLFDQN